MHPGSKYTAELSPTTSCVWAQKTLLLLLLLAGAVFSAHAQSLGDLARQARAEKQDQPRAQSSQAQQLVNQLVEDQDDTGNAPAGFKTYNAGDYRLWVPAPFTVDGHDAAGVVLANATQGRARSLVLAGNPVVLSAASDDDAFRQMASQFAHVYAQSATCTQTSLANRKAYQCGLAGAKLLGHSVSGKAVFVRGSHSVVPVFCVAFTDSRARDVLNDPHSSSSMKRWAQESLAHEDEEVRNAWWSCESVLQSIHLKEDGEASAAKAGKAGSAPANPASEEGSSGDAPAAVDSGDDASLADVAKRLHGAPASAAQADQAPDNGSDPNTPPDGFKAHWFTYCKSHSQECWDALVFVPADAKLVSSSCKQYIFETKIDGQPFLLLAGQSGTGGCDDHAAKEPDPVHWHQLVDPENLRAPGTASIISSLQATIEGYPAVITTLRFKSGVSDWMGKRADVESNGIPLVVGCMAPRDHFPNGEELCSGLIDSMRLP
jgi:hypothetical protein